MTMNLEKIKTPSSNQIVIKKGRIADTDAIQKLAITTFQESHGHSADPEDIQSYIDRKFTKENIETELSDTKNLFHLLYCNGELVAYSKIIFNAIYNELTPSDSTKLERLYVLQKFHGTELGKRLMDFNIHLAKENDQTGIWLYVWTENHRAISFYKKYGFHQIAETVFQISERHDNPNWILYSGF
jgi:ribosomal protein S18 acetylase RimI-like enzyme|tara:strand:- start:13166 stop:13723 length:558 start_codon:yes stop_codon:yes gene_type:complete